MSGSTGAKSANADSYAWIGASNGLWSAAGNWADVTSATSPSPNIPGTATPVSVTGLAGSASEVVAGNGVAAGLAISANVTLSGTVAVSGALTVGSVVATPGSTVVQAGTLTLATGAQIGAGTVAVADGAVVLSTGAGLSVNGVLSIGTASGTNVPYNGSYTASAGALGSVTLNAGATLATVSDLVIASGELTDGGAQVSVGGSLTVGTAATTTAVVPYSNFTYGQVSVTAGGTLAVAGGISDPGGIILVGGAGSRLVAAGTLQASGAALTFYASGADFGQASGSVAAVFGGTVQLGGVVINAPLTATHAGQAEGLTVDALSSIEIGTAGGAAAGAITVDAGRVLTLNTTASLSGALVNNGLVAIAAGTTTQTGNVSGSGTLQIAAGATLALAGRVSGSGTIALLGSGASLIIGSAASLPYAVGATVAGFQAGQTIVLSQSVSTATYTAGIGGAVGTLALSDSSGVIETLSLAGDFTGKSFFVSPASGGAAISLTNQSVGANGTPSTNADAYRWVGASGSQWGGAGNWADTTAAINPVPSIPAAQTAVTIQAATAQIIAGDGTAASLAMSGNVSLNGTITVAGATTIGAMSLTGGFPVGTSFVAGTLALSGAGRYNAGSVNVLDGALLLGANTSLQATGAIALGLASGADVPSGNGYVYTNSVDGAIGVATGATLTAGAGLAINSGTLNVTGGTVVIAGSVQLGTAATPTTSLPYTYPASGQILATAGGSIRIGGGITDPGGVMYVDATSRIEIGNTGSAAAGAITVDAGHSLVTSLSASLSGALVNNGTVVVGGTLSQTGNVSGSGVLQIGANGTLVLAGNVAASETIAFAGTNASLQIGSFAAVSFAVPGVITGFVAGDSIVLAQPATIVGFAPATGILSLSNAAGTVETLHLSGSTAGSAFQVAATSGGGASVSLLGLQASAGGASPYYLKSSVVGGQTVVQLWVKAGTNVAAATVAVRFDPAAASFNGFAAFANATSTVSLQGTGLLSLSVQDSTGVSPVGAGADAVMGTLTFTPTGAAPAVTVSATVTSSTNSAGMALNPQSAGSVAVGVQTAVAVAAYDWKSHALLGATQVVATGSGNPVDAGTAALSFHNVHLDASGNLVGELFADHVVGAQNLSLSMSMPSGVAASFTASTSLPSGWNVVANTATAGVLGIAGMGLSGLTGASDIGTVFWTLPAGSSSLAFQVTADTVGGQSAAPFTLGYAAGQTDANGAFTVATLSADQYALQASRATTDAGTSINAADALAALKIAAGINPNQVSAITGRAPLVSPYQFMAADVNGDGRVTAFDALNILKMAVGLASAPKAKWEFASETTSYWNPGTNSFSVSAANVPTGLAAVAGTAGGLVGILVGDVNGSWAPLDSNNAPVSGYAQLASAHFAGLSTTVAAPIDQWAGPSYSVAGALAAAATAATTLDVLDSTANVAAGIDQLQAMAQAGQLAGIWLSDAAPAILAVSGSQIAADATAIAAIHGNYTLAGGGTASAANGSVAPVLPSATAAISFLSQQPSTPEVVVIGVPAMLDARNGGHVEATIGTAGVVEEVANVTYGSSSIGIDLAGLLATDLVATDVLLGGAHAIFLSHGQDLSHGVVLTGLAATQTASDLMANHLSFVGRYALIG